MGKVRVYVLSGRLDVHFESGEIVQLEQDDALHFRSSLGHAYVSTSVQPAIIVGPRRPQALRCVRSAGNQFALATGQASSGDGADFAWRHPHCRMLQ